MSPPLYVVFHLPKTAGSTLLANFAGNFIHDQLLPMSPLLANWQSEDLVEAISASLKCQTPHTRCAFGHWAYFGIHERVESDAPPAYITFLREPVERCVSLYGYIKSRPHTRACDAIAQNNWTLGQWLEHGEIPELFNGQTRRLCFDGTNDHLRDLPLTRDHLEIAKQRLREFWFVGLTESFAEDSQVLYGRLGFWRFYPVRVVNKTPDKPAATASEKAALLEANELDSELYAFAQELRAQWRRTHAREIVFWRLRTRIMKKIYQSASPLKQALKRSG